MCLSVYSCRMPFQFCPQCGIKLQPEFRFCPSCGEKLPGPGPDEPITVSSTASLSRTPLKSGEAALSVVNTSLVASSTSVEPTESKGKYLGQYFFMSNLVLSNKFSLFAAFACTTSIPLTPRPALRKTRNSLRLDKDVKFNLATAPVVLSTKPVRDDRTEGN